MSEILKLKEKLKELKKEKNQYKKAFELLEEYFGSIDYDEQPKVSKKLERIFKNKNNENYVIINKDTIQKRIEEFEKSNEAMWWKERDALKQILSQSTSLIPEIVKAWKTSKEDVIMREYISNLKLDI